MVKKSTGKNVNWVVGDSHTLFIYTRVSTKVQEKGTSLDEQKKVGLRVSRENDLKPKVYNEGGKSSNSENCLKRPKLQDIMIGIDKGQIKHLFSWNTDRISRDNIFWNQFKTILIKNGVTFYTKDGKYSFDNPEDQLLFNILTSLGQYDNQLRMIRTHRGKMTKVKMGYWLGGPTPFGYSNIDKKLVENKDESKWVKDLFDSFNKVKTRLREIRQHLFIHGVKTRRGNDKWSLGSIDSLLHNQDIQKGLTRFMIKVWRKLLSVNVLKYFLQKRFYKLGKN